MAKVFWWGWSVGTERTFAVLIETVGNQATIFQTNRLKEVIGASHLVYQVGTESLFDAIGKTRNWEKPDQLDAYLLSEHENPPIKNGTDESVEIVVAASGKAIVLTRTEKRAKQIIGNVTKKALEEAPGVTVRGAFVEIKAFTADVVNEALDAVHKEHARIRGSLPSSDLRFQRLPFVEMCASSGLPAEYDEAGEAISLPICARRDVRDIGWGRIKQSVGGDVAFAYSVDKIAELGTAWVGLVHADGNGLGQIFLDFQTHCKAGSAREYIDCMRHFSIAIDQVTRAATRTAILEVWPGGRAPVIPVVLGGDDLTVICDGQGAVKFAERFLHHFEELTKGNEAITRIAPKGLTAAAGVAVVKAHFPFHRAYELAEELCKSAKTKKEHGSSLDFQVLFDTSGAQLKPIRARMVSADKKSMHQRPYLIHSREFTDLRKAVAFLGAKSDLNVGREVEHLPRSQQHAILQAAFRSNKDADNLVERLSEDYGDKINALLEVFILDAMELYDLEAQATSTNKTGDERVTETVDD